MRGFYKFSVLITSIAISASLATAAHAQNGNGTLNAGFYGSPLAVQTINTGFGAAAGGNDSAGGSELDAAYGAISGGNLYLFLAGNFENNGNHLNVFIAGGAAGQNVLALPTTAGMSTMNGSVFSPGFQATWAFDMNNYQGTLYNEEYVYAGPGAMAGGYVGSVVESSLGIGAGTPAGGGFPAFTHLALNNNNASTMGAPGTPANNAAMLATTTGLELQIPLSQIGYTGGMICVLADINGGSDGYLSNQFLPGLAVGTGNVGGGGPYTGSSSAKFNLSNTPNEEFCLVPEPSTIGLVLVGLLGALTIRRRKA